MTKDNDTTPQKPASDHTHVENADNTDSIDSAQKEIGGRKGLDPVRYGDWEIAGKCVDF